MAVHCVRVILTPCRQGYIVVRYLNISYVNNIKIQSSGIVILVIWNSHNFDVASYFLKKKTTSQISHSSCVENYAFPEKYSLQIIPSFNGLCHCGGDCHTTKLLTSYPSTYGEWVPVDVIARYPISRCLAVTWMIGCVPSIPSNGHQGHMSHLQEFIASITTRVLFEGQLTRS